MPTIELSLTINLRDTVPQTICVKQNDTNSRVLAVRLLDGDGPLSLEDADTAVLYVKKQDGTHVFTEGTADDRGQGLLRVPLTAQSVACAGVARCEILLYGQGGSLLSTFPFSMAVVGSVRDEEAVVSSNEYSALTDTMLASRELIARMEELMGEVGPGDLSEIGVQIAAHNADDAAHQDLREDLDAVSRSGYSKGEIDRMLEALGGSGGENPGWDGYTKEETKALLSEHNGDGQAHADLRRDVDDMVAGFAGKGEVDGLIAAHNGADNAHADIRKAIADEAANHYTKVEADGRIAAHNGDEEAHADIRRAIADEAANRYTKVEADGRIAAHNGDEEAHADIREAIADAAANRYTKVEADGRIAAHDGDEEAHADIREAIADAAANHYTKGETDQRIAAHDEDEEAHADIRGAIDDAAANHYTKAEADERIAGHNGDAGAHADIRQALGEKAGKPSAVSGTLSAGGWAGSEAPYTQSLAIGGMKAGSLWHYDIGGQAAVQQVAAFAHAMVWATGEGDGVCHFAAAGEKPELDLPLVVELLG